VGKGIVKKSKIGKYKKHFERCLVEPLEKNCLDVCDPQVNEVYHSQFGKMKYHLPKQISEAIAERQADLSNTPNNRKKPEWKNILSKISLANINMHGDCVQGKRELKIVSNPVSKKAESLLRS
jgi:hypothetical protein